MKRIALLVAGALGYVLGSRAGRGPYEKLSTRSEGIWKDPRVQGRVRQAASLGWYRPGEAGEDGTDVTELTDVTDLAGDTGGRHVSADR